MKSASAAHASSGAAAAAAAAAANDDAQAPPPLPAALPHEVLVRICQFLPRGVLSVTPGRLSHAWAAAKAEVKAALRPPADDEIKRPWLPPWYATAYPISTPDALFNLVRAAAHNGQLEILEHVYATGGPVPFSNACQYAAGGGQIPTLVWLRQKNLHTWEEGSCSAAAAYGRLETLAWLRANGCAWNERTCAAAAQYGQLDVLKFARQSTPPCPWDARVCTAAASNGFLNCLAWARENGAPWWPDTLCEDAASGGHLDVLRFCVAQRCPINVKACLKLSRAFPECQAWLRATFPAAAAQ
jgi:hypothetical protein